MLTTITEFAKRLAKRIKDQRQRQRQQPKQRPRQSQGQNRGEGQRQKKKNKINPLPDDNRKGKTYIISRRNKDSAFDYSLLF